jgi:hypothetical protein
VFPQKKKRDRRVHQPDDALLPFFPPQQPTLLRAQTNFGAPGVYYHSDEVETAPYRKT